MSTLKPIVSAATVTAMTPPPARTKSPPSCLPGRACRTPASPISAGLQHGKCGEVGPIVRQENAVRKVPSRAPRRRAFVAIQMMKEACGAVFSAGAGLADLFHPDWKLVGDPIIRFGFVVEPGNLLEGAIRPGGANRPGVGRRGLGMPDLEGREFCHDCARR